MALRSGVALLLAVTVQVLGTMNGLQIGRTLS
jgi:hypothetical protein